MEVKRVLQENTDVNSANSLWYTTTRIFGLSSGDLNDPPINLNFEARKDDGCGTYSNNLCSNERESSLRNDAPPSNKSASGSRNVVVLDERTGVFPVTEADSGTSVRIEQISQE